MSLGAVMRLRYRKYLNVILLSVPVLLLIKALLYYHAHQNPEVLQNDPRRIRLGDWVNFNKSKGFKNDNNGENQHKEWIAAPVIQSRKDTRHGYHGGDTLKLVHSGKKEDSVVHLEETGANDVDVTKKDVKIYDSGGMKQSKSSTIKQENFKQETQSQPPPVKEGTCDNSKCNPTKDGMLNVHLVVHSHDDVGWKKTYMQYYNGKRPDMRQSNYAGGECTRCILNSVIPELLKDPSRRFVFVEIAFFSLWFSEQSNATKENVRKLIRERRLELIGGGWCMSDSATTYYDDVIDQHTHGFQWIQKELGECAMPKSAWHLDQFGHSREHSSLFSQMGFDGLVVGRIDNWDQDRRMSTKNMETLWRTSPENLGPRTDLFTSVLYDGYFTPSGFQRTSINSLSRRVIIKSFLRVVQQRASVYRTNNVLIPYGGDFAIQFAGGDYSFLDDLVRVVNEEQLNGSKVNLLYSTPTCYINSVNKEAAKFEAIKTDFFPYGIIPKTYWTGFFTSRPGLKRHVKTASSLLQTCKVLSVLAHLPDGYRRVAPFKEAVAVLQHHDAITGTEQQHVTNDYNKLLSVGELACRKAISASYQTVLNSGKRVPDQSFCPDLNISSCPVTEYHQTFSVSVFNALGWEVEHWVRIPVTAGVFVVTAPGGQVVQSQLFPLPLSTFRIPERGQSNANSEIVFKTTIPPVGFSIYNLKRKENTKIPELPLYSGSDNIVISNQHLSLVIDAATGFTSKLTNTESSVSVDFQQIFMYYLGSKGERRIPGDRRGGMGGFFGGHKRASGAYAFVPKENTPPVLVSQKVLVKRIKGTMVQEVHQEFSPWVSQVIRLYDGAPYLELEWTVGPIPDEDHETKEVVSRFQTNLNTKSTWYTDSNGREMIERRLNFHEPFPYNVTCPISGNYYPVTGRMYIRDEDRNIQLTILTDRSQAGGSVAAGQMEFLVHRRTFHDDDLGVEEPLNEVGVDGKGLIIRGKHYVMLNTIKNSPREYRPLGLQIHREPSTTFMPDVEGGDVMATGTWLKKSLPDSVHLLTLDQTELGPDILLLRLENYYEKSERAESAAVNLDDHFPGIQNVQELSLGANHNITDVKRLVWQTLDGQSSPSYTGSEATRRKLEPPYTVTLQPMEIRTFHITVHR